MRMFHLNELRGISDGIDLNIKYKMTQPIVHKTETPVRNPSHTQIERDNEEKKRESDRDREIERILH